MASEQHSYVRYTYVLRVQGTLDEYTPFSFKLKCSKPKVKLCGIDLYILRVFTRHADKALTSLRTLVASIVLPREPLSSVTYMGGARLEKMYRK